MQLRSRWAWWGIGGYTAAALTCTAAWLLLGLQAAERNGLQRELFLVNGFVGRPFRQDVSEDISLDFLQDDDRLPRQRFGVRWRGYWYVPEGGPIEIHGEGDDWLTVHVDGEMVLRRYPPDQMHLATGTVTLAAGVHELLIEYEQEGGAYALDVRWSPPSDRMRSFAGYRLFRERPSMDNVRLAERAAWLGWAVTLLWVMPLLTVAGVGARRAWLAGDRYGPASPYAPYWKVALRAGMALAGVAVIGRALAARLPGMNPPALWHDDLVYAALVRSDNFLDVVTAPIHVAPGLLVLWRGMYAVIPDPEWALQLLPFLCGLAAIPLMALVAYRLTGNVAVGMLTGAVTSLVQLLAHYSVYVRQYTVEFVVTALFLLAATRLLRGGTDVDPQRFRRVGDRRGASPRSSPCQLSSPRSRSSTSARSTPYAGGSSAGSRSEASSGALRGTTRCSRWPGGCCAAGRTRSSAPTTPMGSCRSSPWAPPGAFCSIRAAAC